MDRARARPDRQPRRDRGPDRADGAQPGSADGRRRAPRQTPARFTQTASMPPSRSRRISDPAELLRAARTHRRALGPPRIRVPLGERGVRPRGDRRRSDLDRPAARGDRADGRQGSGEGRRGRGGCAGRPGGAGRRLPGVVKAVAGGGGKGMRVVRSPEELEEAQAAAQREAQAAFGDGRVLIERYLERPRHIEIQVLADRHGTVLHLGERECSLQRRHQKVVEEAPSPVVDAELRARMGAAAVALAQACGYEGAGTVEFIATGDVSEFYLPGDEHAVAGRAPVTELVYGVDLVELQLRIAAGERAAAAPGAARGRRPRGRGAAVRRGSRQRVPAGSRHDPSLPRAGRGRRSRGLRCPRSGSEVGTAYDPMLAKVIAHGPDRADCAAAARPSAGRASTCSASRPTRRSRGRCSQREDVRAGEQDTGLLERVLAELDDRHRRPTCSPLPP